MDVSAHTLDLNTYVGMGDMSDQDMPNRSRLGIDGQESRPDLHNSWSAWPKTYGTYGTNDILHYPITYRNYPQRRMMLLYVKRPMLILKNGSHALANMSSFKTLAQYA